MTLRARLIVCLVVLAGAGLVTLAAVTYSEQQSFLLERVDSQARAGVGPISASLDRAGANVPGTRETAPGLQEPPLGRRGGGPPPQQSLPPGTFGQRRDASGHAAESRRTNGVGLRDQGEPDRRRLLGGQSQPALRTSN